MKKYLSYILLVGAALGLSWVTHEVEAVQKVFTHGHEGLYLVIALLLIVGYGLNSFAPKTAIPSFVWAIFFGLALQPTFVLLTGNVDTLRVIVEILAALVLFGGGVEVPFKNFKRNFGPIAALAMLGTVCTALLFSLFLEKTGSLMGFSIPAAAFLLMGAILASTDPTAIIPSLQALHFKKSALKDLPVSESALNDVVGTILTRFFLVAVLATAGGGTVLTLYKPLLQRETFDSLALEMIWGVLVGIVGAKVLQRWSRTSAQRKQKAVDPALFFAVPIFSFAVGSIVGGSGFLAAFVAGLLFDATAGTKAVHQFFEVFVDRFIKPIIFILLGAVVPLKVMLSVAVLGIIAALAFMFIIRPLAVAISLAPWYIGHRVRFHIKELLFLSFIRETGAIPAVLILVAVGSGVAGSEYIFAIGMWVILFTLILEPPLTPWLAEKLGVAKKV